MIGQPNDDGIIPRFITNLFDKINKLQREQPNESNLRLQIQCEISYYEIYNEKIYDLLRSPSENTKQTTAATPRQHLSIRENPLTGPYIVNLLTISCENAQDMLIWFQIGNKRRATACTNINDKSSRSHSVFQISLKQIKTQNGDSDKLDILTSKINLIDLAGSERLSNIQPANQQSIKQTTSSETRFKESTCINKSLLTLGKIICLLSERTSNTNTSVTTTPSKNLYLPYRESALTWLLKESLGGNSKTAMLATVNCSSMYLDETLSTLRYASKTACIKNSAMLNYNRTKCDQESITNELKMYKEKHLKSINEIELIKNEWQLKLDEANKRKIDELKNLEKSLIVFYENENCSQKCCLINLNEDPLLSEKLIYYIKLMNENCEEIVTTIGSDKNLVDIYLCGPLIASIHAFVLIFKKYSCYFTRILIVFVFLFKEK